MLRARFVSLIISIYMARYLQTIVLNDESKCICVSEY